MTTAGLPVGEKNVPSADPEPPLHAVDLRPHSNKKNNRLKQSTKPARIPLPLAMKAGPARTAHIKNVVPAHSTAKKKLIQRASVVVGKRQ